MWGLSVHVCSFQFKTQYNVSNRYNRSVIEFSIPFKVTFCGEQCRVSLLNLQPVLSPISVCDRRDVAAGVHDRMEDLWRGFPEHVPYWHESEDRVKDTVLCHPSRNGSGYCHPVWKKKKKGCFRGQSQEKSVNRYILKKIAQTRFKQFRIILD